MSLLFLLLSFTVTFIIILTCYLKIPVVKLIRIRLNIYVDLKNILLTCFKRHSCILISGPQKNLWGLWLCCHRSPFTPLFYNFHLLFWVPSSSYEVRVTSRLSPWYYDKEGMWSLNPFSLPTGHIDDLYFPYLCHQVGVRRLHFGPGV